MQKKNHLTIKRTGIIKPAFILAIFLSGCVFISVAQAAASVENVQETVSIAAFTQNPPLIEEAAASVVKLEVYDSRDDRIATGTGFAAIDPRVLVTASHVIVNMEYMLAETDSGETFRIDQVFYADTNADVALCLLPDGVSLPLLPIAKEPLLRGENTAVIGTQFGVKNLVTMGNICGRWESSDVNWILFTAPVSGGCSGGPLFNDRGEVIGIVAGSFEKGQNLNLAAPVECLPELPEE